MSLSTLRSSDLPPTREINHISFDLGARARAGDLFFCVQCKKHSIFQLIPALLQQCTWSFECANLPRS